MSQPWFTRAHWFYRPVSVAGWVLSVVVALFIMHILIAASMMSHSVSDIFYAAFPYVVSALAVFDWVAQRTSR